jgi:glyoxylate/hydroxypyruvate reductase
LTDILICSYLEPEHVARIEAAQGARVHYRPDLIPEPRYAADHIGRPFTRSPKQAGEWQVLMARAEVLFDFDHVDPEGMVAHGRNVRWVQATSAGIGQYVKRHRLERMDATFTTAAGVHARPLAEFVIWALLTFAKNYPQARRQQAARLWQRFHNDDLEGKTLAIVGLGSIGREVAKSARHFGMRVLATKRTVAGVDPHDLGVDALYPLSELHAMLGQADAVVLILPHTDETEGLISAPEFAAMKPGALLVNIGRGASVDEGALLAALQSGKLQGAVLDVAAQEPLPPEHPLWGLENVFIFPHSASTSKNENGRLVTLFLDNLERYRAGCPLRNVFDAERLY